LEIEGKVTKFSRRELIKAGVAASASMTVPLSLGSLLEVAAVRAADGPTPSQRAIDLRGSWRFNRDDAKVGLAERWYEGSLPVNKSGPQAIPLPGTTDETHAGLPNPDPPTLDGLYRPNKYAGPAWYQREVEIPLEWAGKSVSLFLERTHWVTQAWLDGKELGSQESLIAPHIHELGTRVTPGKHVLTLCVDNTLLFDLGRFVSIYFEGTQTNWNGVVGRIELRARDAVFIAKLEVHPNVERMSATARLRIRNLTGVRAAGTIELSVAGQSGPPVTAEFVCPAGEVAIEKEVPLGPDVKLWDEFSPNLYTMRAHLATRGKAPFRDESEVTFGMRKLGIQGTQFTLNGRPLLLRGTLECAIFPLTGYPPTDVDSWRRIYQIEKSYGLNFIRFHSWTPPEAAFAAADIEGVYIQAEGPQANVQTGEVEARDQFVERELLRIVETYGNHPSFTLMTIGNEYGGSMPVVTHWVDMLIKADDRHFYSSASSNKLKAPNRQFTEDAHLRGVHGPGTIFDYSEGMAKEDRPLIGHEIGQWTYYPNLDEIRKYTGVLQAKNFEIVAADLTKKGMRDEARQFLEATGKHAILLYKDEIESIVRTRGYAGFSLLDLHDYPGTGMALIGFLDPFWDSKGLIAPAEHKRYCGPVVPLLRFDKRTFSNGEEFQATADLANFGRENLNQVRAAWSIADASGGVVASGSLAPVDSPTGRLTQLGSFNASLSPVTRAAKLAVSVRLPKTDIANCWEIWVYPANASVAAPSNLVVANAWDSGAKSALAQGKRVIAFPANLPGSNALKGSFKPVFWSPIWFKWDPATMGILVNPDHPIFSQFPTDFYSNWQWDSLIEGSQSVILDESPLAYRPLVQVIDNFARNHRLGTVFEARVGEGRLLVCTLNLSRDKESAQTVEQLEFLRSLYAYAASETFAPRQELSVEVLDKILGS